jgi:acyl-CoA thioester hydrolase
MTDAAPARFRYRRVVPLRFGDLDVLGHVNHRAYLDLLETARVGYYFDVVGLDSVHQIKFVLAELHVHYRASAVLGQTLEVALRVSWLKRSSSGFEYEIRDHSSGELLVHGEGVQVYLDLAANRSERLPEVYAERIRRFEPEPPRQL